MRTIFKYSLEITDRQTISLPQYFSILKVDATKDGRLWLWAEVNTEREDVPITIRIFGTGHPILDTDLPLTHLNTIISAPFVWHVYLQH